MQHAIVFCKYMNIIIKFPFATLLGYRCTGFLFDYFNREGVARNPIHRDRQQPIHLGAVSIFILPVSRIPAKLKMYDAGLTSILYIATHGQPKIRRPMGKLPPCFIVVMGCEMNP